MTESTVIRPMRFPVRKNFLRVDHWILLFTGAGRKRQGPCGLGCHLLKNGRLRAGAESVRSRQENQCSGADDNSKG
jgi:hypothetical protein